MKKFQPLSAQRMEGKVQEAERKKDYRKEKGTKLSKHIKRLRNRLY